MPIGIGLLGLGTVGAGVAEILLSPQGRHPLVADLELRQVAVRDLNRPRPIPLSNSLLTTDPAAVVANPDVDLVVEVMGGLEPARSSKSATRGCRPWGESRISATPAPTVPRPSRPIPMGIRPKD